MGNTTFIVYILILLGLFYLMVFFPESRRKKKYNEMLNALKTNDEILTKGGIIGKVISIGETFVIVQSGPDRVRFKLDKNGISMNLTEAAAAPKKTVKKENKKETVQPEEKSSDNE